jgi:hypothetical protein
METKQYYTPDARDLRIGYECELKQASYDGGQWIKNVIDEEEACFHGDYNENHFADFASAIRFGTIRTPYLTQEQIVAEGWNVLQVYPDGGLIFEKRNYELLFKKGERITITEVRESFELTIREQLYKGSCPSINEFRTLCKLLSI